MTESNLRPSKAIADPAEQPAKRPELACAAAPPRWTVSPPPNQTAAIVAPNPLIPHHDSFISITYVAISDHDAPSYHDNISPASDTAPRKCPQMSSFLFPPLPLVTPLGPQDDQESPTQALPQGESV